MASSGSRKRPAGGAPRGGAVWVRQREAKVVEMRATGATFLQIADALGVKETMARRIFHRGLARVVREPVERLIALECERLDMILRAHMPRALRGSARSAEVVLRAMERRSRMLGLDAPVRSEVHVMTAEEQDALDREIEQLLATYHHPPEADQ